MTENEPVGKGALWTGQKGLSGRITVGEQEYRLFIGESSYKDLPTKSGKSRPDKYVIVWSDDE